MPCFTVWLEKYVFVSVLKFHFLAIRWNFAYLHAFRSKWQDKTNSEANLRSFLFLYFTGFCWFLVAICGIRLPVHLFSHKYIVHNLVGISIFWGTNFLQQIVTNWVLSILQTRSLFYDIQSGNNRSLFLEFYETRK